MPAVLTRTRLIEMLAGRVGVGRSNRRWALPVIEKAVDAVDAGEGEPWLLDIAMRLVGSARHEVDRAEEALINRAREQGMSWAMIAQSLGLGSRQAAEQRYLRLRAAREDRERDPQVFREIQQGRRRQLELLQENEEWLRQLAGDIADVSSRPVAGEPALPDRPVLRTRLSILRRDLTRSSVGDLFTLLSAIAEDIEPAERAALPTAIRDGLARLQELID
jgi:hypothetical protein